MYDSFEQLAEYHACAKLILLGEHFVVHNVPAIALPLKSIRTTVHVSLSHSKAQLITKLASELDLRAQKVFSIAMEKLDIDDSCNWRVTVDSQIPVGLGLGSSAAFAVALIGALARAAGKPLDLFNLNAYAHDLEKIQHGNPSGIDNTVIAFERPVWFRTGIPAKFLEDETTFRFLLASNGKSDPTRQVVGRVQDFKKINPTSFDRLCAAAEALTKRGLQAFQHNDARALGQIMDQNHALLCELGVSTPTLDHLVNIARTNGAIGAKMTGAGGGGFMVALVDRETERQIESALKANGATIVLSNCS
ncbi:MAG: mevalonate kinase [Pseudomonadota bacterium]